MPAGQEDIDYGAVVYIDDGPSNTFVALPEIKNLVPPAAELAMVDRTHINSPNRRRQKRPGWDEPGNGSVQSDYLKDQMTRLLAIRRNPNKNLKVVYGDGSMALVPICITKVMKDPLKVANESAMMTTNYESLDEAVWTEGP